MATKKKLLQAAAGSAGGAGPLNVEDVFSTYVYEGNGSYQVIDNGINLGQANYGKSIYFPDGDGDYLATATLPQFTSAFTYELWFYSFDDDRAIYLIDKNDRDSNFSIVTNYLTSFDQMFVRIAGTLLNYSSVGFDPDGWNHVAVVRDSSNNVATFVNGTRVTTTSVVSGTVNAGAYYIGSNSSGTGASGYELMYGHMSSVRISDNERYSTSSTSITVPTSEFTSDSNTVLLLGQGDTPLADASSNSYSVTVNGGLRASEVGPYSADEAGEGGLVWVKERTALSSGNHELMDTERGTSVVIFSDLTNGNFSKTNGLTSFNSNGFSIGSNGGWNNNTSDYASWTFRKAPKFFTCLTYTGTGDTTTQTISHDLGAVPGCIIVKRTDSADSWRVYHRGVDVNGDSQPWTDMLTLNSTNAASDFPVWGDTAPTSTEFTVGYESSVNASGATYVAYLFAHNDGDGDFGPTGDQDVIRCGSFTGTGATNNFVNLGFEPQFIMFKSASVSEDWFMFDNMRGTTVGNDVALYANLSNGDGSPYDNIDFNATGFTLKDTYWGNRSGSDYIYIAIRRGPMAVPTDATDVFDVETSTSGAPRTWSSGFPVDLSIYCHRDTYTSNKYVGTRLTGNNAYLVTNGTSAEGSISNAVEFDYSDKIIENNLGDTNSKVNWMWKRAPSFFDVVAWTGDGVAGRTVSHNLGVAPEMMWVKGRDVVDEWHIYHSGIDRDGDGLPETDYAIFGTAQPTDSVTIWNDTAPTDSVFTLGNNGGVNGSGNTYIAYLFASLDGVSKVGSYTGNGTSQTIDCGFSSGARFVLIKRTDSTSDWWVFDTARGIVAGNDGLLALNGNATEGASYDNIDPDSSGFIINNTAWNENASGGTYIFYAIA